MWTQCETPVVMPPMPTLVPTESSAGLSERHSDLHHPRIRVRHADEGTAPFRGQLDVRSPAVSHNRFAPLDGQEAADAAV